MSLNEGQQNLQKDIIEVIELGIKAGGYVSLSQAEIFEVLHSMSPAEPVRNGSDPVVISISTIDPGSLLLAAANNSAHIHPELQKAIARFLDIWAAPLGTIKALELE